MKTAQLRRIFRVVNGGTPTSDDDNWDGDIAWATPVDLARVNGGRLVATDRRLTSAGLATGSRLVPAGSLIISSRAPVGYVAECTVPMAFNQGCKGLVPNQEVDIRYYRYQLASLADRLGALGQGSTFVEISGDALSSIELVTPSLTRQQNIADFLDAETERIDALIAKKVRSVQLLAERQAVVIKDSTTGTSADEGIRLRHVSRLVRGSGFPHEHQGNEKGELPFYKVGDLSRPPNDPYLVECQNWVSRDTASRLRAKVIPAGSVLFPKIGAALLGGVRRISTVPSLCDNNVLAVIPLSSEVRFVRYWLITVDLAEIANPGPVPSLDDDAFRDLVLPVRGQQRQAAIADALDLQMKRTSDLIGRTNHQIDLLRERRQALITAAVTGELDIPGAAA